MSRALTGVVKAGYSPHEQYSSDGRQQGPWSDIYALGATLYRAVAGYPPEEVTLRVDQDHMRPATQAANGRYRPEFLSAIDACLKVRHSERPRSVAQLRPMLLDAAPPAKREPESAKARQPMSGPMSTRKASTLRPPPRRARAAGRPWRQPCWPSWAALMAASNTCAGSLRVRRGDCGGQAPGCGHRGEPPSGGRRGAATGGSDGSRPAPGCARRREASPGGGSGRQPAPSRTRCRAAAARAAEAAAASQRQAELEAEQRRKDEAERVAAAARRDAEERARVATATLSADERATFVRQVQEVLKKGRCYDGAINGRSNNGTQEALDDFVAGAGKEIKTKPVRIELAKATAGDFEAWLRAAGEFKGDLCAAKPKPPKEVAKTPRQRDEETPATTATGYSQTPGRAIGKWRIDPDAAARAADGCGTIRRAQWSRSQMHADTRWAQVRLALRPASRRRLPDSGQR